MTKLKSSLILTILVSAPYSILSFYASSVHRSSTQLLSSKDEEVDNGMSDDLLYASLMKRDRELSAEKSVLSNRWRHANFQSSVRLNLDDWIRRLHVDRWPLTVVGSASGSLYMVDLSTGEVLDSVLNEHDQHGGNDQALSMLHGNYDGGGIIAIVMKDELIFSAGREGSVKGWKFKMAERKLVPLGELQSLRNVLTTSLVLDTERRLWVGGFDGSLSMFHFDRDSPLVLQKIVQLQKPIVLQLKSPVLSLCVCEQIGLVACACSNGSIELISTDGTYLASWNPFKNTYARSVTILERSQDNWSVICGGGDGTIFMHPLVIDPTDGSLSSSPLSEKMKPQELRPPHDGHVVSLTSRSGGFLISGAQDGTIRVWDCSPSGTKTGTDQPTSLYALNGYKVWLDSVFTDDVRLLSDGSDNRVVVHDFSLDNNDVENDTEEKEF